MLLLASSSSGDGCVIWGMGIFFVAIVAFGIFSHRDEEKKKQELAKLPKAEREKLERMKLEREAERKHGEINQAMICPHCQSKGSVRVKKVIQKKGVSGGKATAAVLTGGASLLVAGLSRKEELSQAHCENCHNGWAF
ncbi:MAG: hypothetical protein H6Q00_2016 [Holophagaceae bacterium]|nr:hypothetical protein [Holophagaceae bacterium]